MSTQAAPADAPAPATSRKTLLVGVVVVALAAAAGWWFLLRPAGASAEPAPEPGEVVALEPIQVNLADGHYLRLGLALQATADAAHVEGSKALDAAIDLFSGQSRDALTQPVHRRKLKRLLMTELDERYHGEVMEVYFTEFVTQ